MKAKATVMFFKPNGKYYTDEIYEFENIEDHAYKVFGQIEKHYAGDFRGMLMVVIFDETYPQGYPFMQPVHER